MNTINNYDEFLPVISKSKLLSNIHFPTGRSFGEALTKP